MRTLDSTQTASQQTQDFGNWQMPLLNTQLTHDQADRDALGAAAPWREGATIWLQMPNVVDLANTVDTINPLINNLRFSLAVTELENGQLSPKFSSAQGWSLRSGTLDANSTTTLVRQGDRLYQADTGLAWVPTSLVLTSEDGVQYQINQSGDIEQIKFADGTHWLITDSGIALIGDSTRQARVQFIRDTAGRVERVVGPNTQNDLTSMVYRYDSEGKLIMVRPLMTGQSGLQYGYDDQGQLLSTDIDGYLGTAVNWMSDDKNSNRNSWKGNLEASSTNSGTVTLSYGIRDSELASTQKAAGATGIVLVMVTHTTGSVITSLGAGTQLLSSHAGANGIITSLIRVTKAGFKQLQVTGQGSVTVSVQIAGDLNQDGRVDGLDSALWESAQKDNNADIYADLNGDGNVTATDRQILFSNYGFRANTAPVNILDASKQANFGKTHADLGMQASLADVAQDLEGDAIFWQVIGSTHGTGELMADGQTLMFKPVAGYTGMATVVLQADDGFTTSRPIELTFEVSDARLMMIHIERIKSLALGGSDKLYLTGDFEDESGVYLPADYVQFISSNDSVVHVDALGNVQAVGVGKAVVTAKARGIEGVNAFTVSVSGASNGAANDIEVDVYPLAVTLPLQGQRQLKVTDVDGNRIDKSIKGTTYHISDNRIAEISADGLIYAKQTGSAKISVINNGRQYDLTLNIQAPVSGVGTIIKDNGIVVQDDAGNQLMVAPGSLAEGTKVSIQKVEFDKLGMPLPGAGTLTGISAFEINVGAQDSQLPLQVGVNVKGFVDPKTGKEIQTGSEVHFWRKGQIMDDDGTVHDTWWLVDNGFVGDDGIARTASPPYGGFGGSGSYIITQSDYDPDTGAVKIKAFDYAGYQEAMWAPIGMMATSLTGAMVGVAMMGMFASMATSYVVTHTIAGTFKRLIPNTILNLDNLVVETQKPLDIPTSTPFIEKLEFDPDTYMLTLSGDDFYPDSASSNMFEFKVWLEPRGDQLPDSSGGDRPDRGLVFHGFTPDSVSRNEITLKIDPKISLSQHFVYIERIAYSYVNGVRVASAMSTVSPMAKTWEPGPYKNTIVLTRDSIDLVRTGTNQKQFSFVRSITKDEKGNKVGIWGYQTDSIAYSHDGTLAFVVGGSYDDRVIYVIDTSMSSIVHTIKLANQDSNISSLMVNDGWLYIAEDRSLSSRILRVLIDPSSSEYLKVQQSLDLGFMIDTRITDMAISNGRYLGFVTPKGSTSIGNMYGWWDQDKRGNIYVVDLNDIDEKGRLKSQSSLYKVDNSALQSLGTGSSPEFITHGVLPGEFLVSHAQNTARGVVAVKLQLDAETGNIAGSATLSKTGLYPDDDRNYANRPSKQTIQRSAETVVVVFEGEVYALVADYAFHFNDPTFNQWVERPIPFPWGGGVFVPQQLPQPQIGGKIGIIKDPFGHNGEPEYLGATSVINGGTIRRLTLSQTGMLEADVWMYDIPTPNGGNTSARSMFVWDAGALLSATTKNSRSNKSVPIDTIDRKKIPEVIPSRFDTPNGKDEFGWIYGIESYQDAYVTPTLQAKPISGGTNQFEIDISKLKQFSPAVIQSAAMSLFLISSVQENVLGKLNIDTSATAARIKLAKDLYLTTILEGSESEALEHLNGQLNAMSFELGGDVQVTQNLHVISGFLDLMEHELDDQIKPITKALGFNLESTVDTYASSLKDVDGYLRASADALMLTADIVSMLTNFRKGGLLTKAGAISLKKATIKTLDPRQTLTKLRKLLDDNKAVLASDFNKYRTAQTLRELKQSGGGLDLQKALAMQKASSQAVKKAEVNKYNVNQSVKELSANQNKTASIVLDKKSPTVKGSSAYVLKKPTATKGQNAGNNEKRKDRDDLLDLGGVIQVGSMAVADDFDIEFIEDTGNPMSLIEVIKQAADDGVFFEWGYRVDSVTAVSGIGSDTVKIRIHKDVRVLKDTDTADDDNFIDLIIAAADGGFIKEKFEEVLPDFDLKRKSGRTSITLDDDDALHKVVHADTSVSAEKVFGGYLLNVKYGLMGKLTDTTNIMDGATLFLSKDILDNLSQVKTVLRAQVEEVNKILKIVEDPILRNHDKFLQKVTPEYLQELHETASGIADLILAEELINADGALEQNPFLPPLIPEGIQYQRTDTVEVKVSSRPDWLNVVLMGNDHEKAISQSKTVTKAKFVELISNVTYEIYKDGVRQGVVNGVDGYVEDRPALKGEKGIPVGVRGVFDFIGIRDGKAYIVEAKASHKSEMKEFIDSFNKSGYADVSALTPEQEALKEIAFSDNQRKFYRAILTKEYQIKIISSKFFDKIEEMKLDILDNEGFLLADSIELDHIVMDFRSYDKGKAEKGKYVVTADLKEIYEMTAERMGVTKKQISSEPTNLDKWNLINNDVLNQIIPHAISYWQAQGVDVTALQQARIQVASLPAGIAGTADNLGNIQLDDDGAGYGWFVDGTPHESSEYQMDDTSTYGVTDQDALKGKLDLLTVVIHEMGHLLGLSDIADSQSIMASHITTGTRRLPTAASVQLVRDIQAGRNDLTNIEQAKYAGFAGAHKRILGFTAVRDGANGAVGTGAMMLNQAVNPQHAWQAVIANSTLGNATFAQDSLYWLTQGQIATGDNQVILSESDNCHTRVAQAFSLTADNRILSFTIENKFINKMQHNAGDAFEVALLDARTGEAVTKVTDLTRTDSLLNIQADNSERIATGVKKVVNSDGTATYYIDLTRWYTEQTQQAKATDVLLSFDLLGFGAADSSVTIKDIKLTRDPVASGDTYATAEDTRITANLLDNDVLVGHDVASVNLLSQPTHGSVSIRDDGSFDYLPEVNYYGTDSFSYQFIDSAGNISSTAVVSLAISPVNDAPVIDTQALTGLIDGQDIIAGTPVVLDLTATGTDVEGDTLSIVITQQPTNGTITQQADGSYVLLFEEDYEGADSFSYVITDGTDRSEPVTASINVLPSNKAPVATSSTLTMLEDGTVVIPLATLGYDADGDALTISITQPPAHGTLEQRTDSAGHPELVYIPQADYYGSDSFSYRLADHKVSSETATVSLTVTAVDDAPISQDDHATTTEDTAVIIGVQRNDADIDSSALTSKVVSQATHGTVVVNADGSITYTPDADYHGTDSFTYTLNDGELDGNIATVHLTITPVNDAPVLTGQRLTIAEDTALIIQPLATASDIDGDTLTVVITQQPSHGTLTQQTDGSYVYQGNDNYNGTDSIRYYVTDGSLNSAERVIDLTVTAVNDAPVADTSLIVGVEDTAYMLGWTDFAISDVDSDLNAQTTTLHIIDLPSAGYLQHQSKSGDWQRVTAPMALTKADIDAGRLRFVPLTHESGGAGYLMAGVGNQHKHYARIGYQVSDGQLLSNTGSVLIDITAVADTPTLTALRKPVTSTLFHSGFEGVANANSNSTLLTQPQFDGWQLIRQDERTQWQQWKDFFTQGSLPYGNDGFEIWHTGDQLANNWGIKRPMQASATLNVDGTTNSSWLELNDAAAGQSQTLGIQREVQTIQGAQYTLSFEYAGRNGFSNCHTGISIYLGDTLIRQHSATSPQDRLDWHNIQVTFTGTGKAEMLRIVTDSELHALYGRGAMLDNVRLSETKASNQGLEDSAIAVDTLHAQLTDIDGSEHLILSLGALPIGTTLTDGQHRFTAQQGKQVAQLNGWQLDRLRLTPPKDYSGQLSLDVIATSVELATGSMAHATHQLVIDVAAVADTPVISLSERDIPTRQLVQTDFENVTNWDTGSDKLHWFDSGATGGDAWRAVTAKVGKVIGFEFWSRGDSIITPQGKKIALNPAVKGEHWMMLHDGLGLDGRQKAHQLLGIHTDIETIAGKTYTLSFDYAAMLGMREAALGRIEVYVNDTLLGRHTGTSGSNLDWQHLSHDFIGTGSKVTVKILLDGVAMDDKALRGRMAMLDNLSVVETLTARIDKDDAHLYALAGTATALPSIAVTSADTDGSESYHLQLAGLPAGFSLSDGTRTITNSGLEPITVSLSKLDVTKLTLTPPCGYCGEVTMTLYATATEQSNLSTAISRYDIRLTVLTGEPAKVTSGYVHSVTTSQPSVADETEPQTKDLVIARYRVLPNLSDGSINFTLLFKDEEDNSILAERVRQTQSDAWLTELEAQATKNWQGFSDTLN